MITKLTRFSWIKRFIVIWWPTLKTWFVIWRFIFGLFKYYPFYTQQDHTRTCSYTSISRKKADHWRKPTHVGQLWTTVTVTYTQRRTGILTHSCEDIAFGASGFGQALYVPLCHWCFFVVARTHLLRKLLKIIFAYNRMCSSFCMYISRQV